jgi:hypothetical protein
MGRQESNLPEIRRIRRLLRETVRLAEHASLTGSLDKGSRIAIRQYNHIREHLQEIGAVPVDLFQELDEDESTFDELGIVCGMLEGYLVEDEEILNEGKGPTKVQVGMVGLKELEDLKEIGKVIRESLPEFLRKHSHGGPSDAVRIEIERGMEAAEAVRDAVRQAERELHQATRQAEREARHAEREAEREVRDAEREMRDAEREAEREAQRANVEEQRENLEQRAQEVADLTNQIRDIGERLRQPDLQNGQREELLQRLNDLMASLQQIA